MDNQTAENCCSNGKILKILVLVVIALQLVGMALSANFFTSTINHVSAVPVANAVPTHKDAEKDDVASFVINGYSNKDYGFAMSVPKAWSDIGYVTKNEKGSNGQLVAFNYYLLSGSDSSLFKISSIGVYPIATYVKDQCTEEGPCAPGVEVGRNNQYVFVSENFSPEAFSACYGAGADKFGGDFYENNKSLCEVGATQRQTERIKGNFSAF